MAMYRSDSWFWTTSVHHQRIVPFEFSQQIFIESKNVFSLLIISNILTCINKKKTKKKIREINHGNYFFFL